MMEDECGACAYWEPVGTPGPLPEFQTGRCRRNPPAVAIRKGPDATHEDNFDEYMLDMSEFPRTLACEWCGEFTGMPIATDWDTQGESHAG